MTEPPSAPTPRLYLNHDVPKTAAEALRSEGYDVVATDEVGLADASDEEQLAWAAKEGRTLVSFNVRDYPSLHLKYLQEELFHSGIVLSKQMGIKETIRALKVLLTTTTPEDLKSQLRWL